LKVYSNNLAINAKLTNTLDIGSKCIVICYTNYLYECKWICL